MSKKNSALAPLIKTMELFGLKKEPQLISISDYLVDSENFLFIITEYEELSEELIKDFLLLKDCSNSFNPFLLTDSLPFDEVSSFISQSHYYNYSEESIDREDTSLKILINQLKSKNLDFIYSRGDGNNKNLPLSSKFSLSFNDYSPNSNFSTFIKDSSLTIGDLFPNIHQPKIVWQVDDVIKREVLTMLKDVGLNKKNRIVLFCGANEISGDELDLMFSHLIESSKFRPLIYGEKINEVTPSIKGLNSSYMSALALQVEVVVTCNNKCDTTIFDRFKTPVYFADAERDNWIKDILTFLGKI